jgi:site-specific DNA-methyltransferase (adenine-specific)
MFSLNSTTSQDRPLIGQLFAPQSLNGHPVVHGSHLAVMAPPHCLRWMARRMTTFNPLPVTDIMKRAMNGQPPSIALKSLPFWLNAVCLINLRQPKIPMSMPLPINQVIHGDCIEILAKLPENSIDVVFADPPYNLQLQQDLYRPNMTKVDAVVDQWDKFSGFAEYDQFTCNWLTACRRVLKESGTIWVIGTYHNIFRVGSIMQDLDYWILNDVIWIKTNPMPNFRGVRFSNAHETLIWAQKKRGSPYVFNHHDLKSLNDDLQMRSDWTLPLTNNKERIKINGSKAHSTQKPSALLYRILMSSTNPGDIVLDPFFGSGTTGAVAKMLQRNWIGIEQEKKYINIARSRIDNTTSIPFDTAILDGHRKARRIPFGKLIELGYLKPGQSLWSIKGNKKATILSNGKIRCGQFTDSIHGMAKKLTDASANGWDFWLFEDENGIRKPIDELRKSYCHDYEDH